MHTFVWNLLRVLFLVGAKLHSLCMNPGDQVSINVDHSHEPRRRRSHHVYLRWSACKLLVLVSLSIKKTEEKGDDAWKRRGEGGPGCPPARTPDAQRKQSRQRIGGVSDPSSSVPGIASSRLPPSRSSPERSRSSGPLCRHLRRRLRDLWRGTGSVRKNWRALGSVN